MTSQSCERAYYRCSLLLTLLHPCSIVSCTYRHYILLFWIIPFRFRINSAICTYMKHQCASNLRMLCVSGRKLSFRRRASIKLSRPRQRRRNKRFTSYFAETARLLSKSVGSTLTTILMLRQVFRRIISLDFYRQLVESLQAEGSNGISRQSSFELPRDYLSLAYSDIVSCDRQSPKVRRSK